MSAEAPPPAAAVPGLTRSDPHGPGIIRERGGEGFCYRDPSGAAVTDPGMLQRIGALRIPPAWTEVWVSPDPLGHIQATGVDSRGRTQYRYHQVWREQRDAQKFEHMLRFAGALPALRSATVRDLGGRHLDRDRVAAGRGAADRPRPVPHRWGEVRRTRSSLRRDDAAEARRHGDAGRCRVRLHRQGGQTPDDHGRRRGGSGPSCARWSAATIPSSSLFCVQDAGSWRPLRSHEVTSYIATHADGHFTAKEFRTWNATVLMALLLANAEPAPTARSRKSTVIAGIRGVADWLGDTPTVARSSYIDPRLISRYESDGQLPAIPRLPAVLPAAGGGRGRRGRAAHGRRQRSMTIRRRPRRCPPCPARRRCLRGRRW